MPSSPAEKTYSLRAQHNTAATEALIPWRQARSSSLSFEILGSTLITLWMRIAILLAAIIGTQGLSHQDCYSGGSEPLNSFSPQLQSFSLQNHRA